MTNNIKGKTHKVISIFLNRKSIGQKGMAWYIPSDENKEPTTKNMYPARLLFRSDGEIKCFSDKQKLREFSTNKPVLQQILKNLL